MGDFDYHSLCEDEQRLLAFLQRDRVQRRQRTDRLPYRQAGYPRPPSHRRVPSLKPGSIAAVINEIEGCGPELSSERAMRWGREFFTPSEVRAWLEAGLTTDDLPRITDLRALGVPPEAMRLEINKETILDRIRVHRYSSEDVARTLRQAGLLERKLA